MKLLITTQAVDLTDPVLGVYHDWIVELSKHIEHIEVICLKEGSHSLPEHVRVHSLGKENLSSNSFPLYRRIKYISSFLSLVWRLRHEYDAVFVHMNQEYILVAGWFWKLLRKRIYLWRNHHTGSYATDIAALFCTKLFCTSDYSYTAKYRKTVRMSVGVNTNLFKRDENVQKIPHSILFLGRIAPSKRPDVLLKSLAILHKVSISFTASIYGDALPKDRAYYESLKKYTADAGLAGKVSFYAGVANRQTPAIYNSHEVVVNLSPSGMLDKTIFEAMACECLVLAPSKDLSQRIDQHFICLENNPENVAQKIEALLRISEPERKIFGNMLRDIALANSLEILGVRLVQEMN